MRQTGILALGLVGLVGLRGPALRGQTAGAAWVRHAPVIHGRVEGSVQAMKAEDVVLGGNASVTGDLLVPGTPAVHVNGRASYGGTIDGAGAVAPGGHDVVLNGHASLRHVIRRTDPRPLPDVEPPPPPGGRRRVVLRRRGDSAGDFATVRDLTVEGEAGLVAVPPGTYGEFAARGEAGLVLGIAGANAPAGYNFQRLVLGHRGALQVVGPVVVTVDGRLEVERDSVMGARDRPEWLRLRVSGGGLAIDGDSEAYVHLEAPAGTVVLNGHSRLVGSLTANRLIVNGESLVRLATAAPNAPPTIVLTAPADGAAFVAPAVVTLAAAASDPDGAVAKVEFFQGTTRLGEDLAAPYELAWAGVPAGAYVLTAVATDDAGATTISAPVAISVATPLNQPPSVALIAPVDGATFTAPTSVHLEAAASDPEGALAGVEFYQGSIKLGEAAGPPFAIDWLNVPPGAYTLTARAVDGAGASATSAPCTISVAAGMPFAADFEQAEGYVPGPLDGQGGWTADGATLVTGADAQHGDQSVVFAAAEGAAQGRRQFSDAIDGAVVFTDFHAIAAAGADAAGASRYETDVARLAVLRCGSAGVIWVFDGDGAGGGVWKATDACFAVGADGVAFDWHRLTIRADYSAKKWDCYVDGMIAAADCGFADSGPTRFSTFAVFGRPSASSLLDNFTAGFDNPLFADSDKDGMPDAWELAHGMNPALNDRDGDADGDGLSNLRQYWRSVRPADADSDHDGIPDRWEIQHGLDPLNPADAAGDLVGDGVPNLIKYLLGRDPAVRAVRDSVGAVNLRVFAPAP